MHIFFVFTNPPQQVNLPDKKKKTITLKYMKKTTKDYAYFIAILFLVSCVTTFQIEKKKLMFSFDKFLYQKQYLTTQFIR